MRLYLSIIFILFCCYSYAQTGSNVIVINQNITKEIPAFVRENNIYFSLKDFADALSINYYYNEDAQKIEVKFDRYSVKVSAKNPFLKRSIEELTSLGNTFCLVSSSSVESKE